MPVLVAQVGTIIQPPDRPQTENERDGRRRPITRKDPSEPAPSVIRTFLIADLRGYTRFSDSRGDEAAAALAERFVAVAEARGSNRARERSSRFAGTRSSRSSTPPEKRSARPSISRRRWRAIETRRRPARRGDRDRRRGGGAPRGRVPRPSTEPRGTALRSRTTGRDPRHLRARAPGRRRRGRPIRGPRLGPPQGDLAAGRTARRRACDPRPGRSHSARTRSRDTSSSGCSVRWR